MPLAGESTGVTWPCGESGWKRQVWVVFSHRTVLSFAWRAQATVVTRWSKYSTTFNILKADPCRSFLTPKKGCLFNAFETCSFSNTLVFVIFRLNLTTHWKTPGSWLSKGSLDLQQLRFALDFVPVALDSLGSAVALHAAELRGEERDLVGRLDDVRWGVVGSVWKLQSIQMDDWCWYVHKM